MVNRHLRCITANKCFNVCEQVEKLERNEDGEDGFLHYCAVHYCIVSVKSQIEI